MQIAHKHRVYGRGCKVELAQSLHHQELRIAHPAGRGRAFDVDVSFYDLVRKILEHGDTLIGAMGNIEARNGPLSLYADGVYTLINVSTNISRYRDISPRVSATLDAALDLRIQLGIAEAGAMYEIARFGLPFGPTTTIPVAFDVLAGARYWYIGTSALTSRSVSTVSWTSTPWHSGTSPRTWPATRTCSTSLHEESE